MVAYWGIQILWPGSWVPSCPPRHQLLWSYVLSTGENCSLLEEVSYEAQSQKDTAKVL